MTRRTILNLTMAVAATCAVAGTVQAMPLASGAASAAALGESNTFLEKAAVVVVGRPAVRVVRPAVRVVRPRPLVRVIR